MITSKPLVKNAAALLGAAFLLVPSLSPAATLVVDITESSYVRSSQATTIQGSPTPGPGAAVSNLLGDINGSNDDMRIIFSVSLTNPLLADQTITNATLKLKVSATDASSNSTETIQLFQLTQSFVENQATWNNRATGTPWTSAGGTFGGSPLATLTANPSTVTLGTALDLSSVNLTSLAQASIGSTLYFIVKLENEDNVARSLFRLGSDDNSTTAYRPQFEIEYAAIPEPSTYAILLSGAVGVLALVRRRRQD